MKISKSCSGCLIFLLIMVALFFLMIWIVNEDTRYLLESNWNFSQENFENEYIPYFLERIKYWADKYGLEYKIVVEDYGERGIRYNLCTDECTFMFSADNSADEILPYGRGTFQLFYYETTPNSIFAYENQREYVMLLNDVINDLVYRPSKRNDEFEKLFNDALNDYKKGVEPVSKYGCIIKSNTIHYNEFVGEIEYVVFFDVDGAGLYYQMCDDENLQLKCNRFIFEGVLKPKP